MDREQAYEKMAERKSSSKDFGTYIGDNGRVNRCVQLMMKGKIKTGRTLIDVGGGIGDLCWSVTHTKFDDAPLFSKAFCVDISRKNLEAAASKIGSDNTVYLDVDKEGLRTFADNKADVVTALDFIEHIVDPENFARECFRVLSSNGQVFINTPNIQYFDHIRSIWQDGKFPHTSGDRELYHGGHLAFFTYNDLVEIFSSAGFTSFEQIKDDEGYHQPPDFFLQHLVRPKNQSHYQELCMRLGCPNLLFKAMKP
jgi:predicted SAM-dependent methyltransferase